MGLGPRTQGINASIPLVSETHNILPDWLGFRVSGSGLGFRVPKIEMKCWYCLEAAVLSMVEITVDPDTKSLATENQIHKPKAWTNLAPPAVYKP